MSRILNLKKSKSDIRNYLFKHLNNKLKVLLISDNDADKSSAALNVNIGSLSDPKDFPGLAHFCEHMLFMGTEKYPKEEEYTQYLNQNSGSSNAYTSLDVTNYYFDVSNSAFEGALDRFAQFFLNPLFIADTVEREMKAVDSENKKNLQNDSWRFLQLMRSESNENSVFNSFSTGNLETLNKPHIREALLEMHSNYYSSDLMSLAVLSNKSIEELEKLVDSLFDKVQKKENLILPKYNEVPAYDKNNCGYMYNVVPVKESDSLYLYWFLPDSSKDYKSHPLKYLSSLFGHEGPNTLTASLIRDDLISSLSSGYENISKTYTKFSISMVLTKKGLNSYNDVISRVIHYVKLIQSEPINKRFFDEIQQINQLNFDYKNKESPINYTTSIAYNFVLYNPEDILTGPYLIEEYDENLIRNYLNSLTLENLNIYLTSKSVDSKCNLTEKWYGTKFSKEKFSEEFIAENYMNISSNHKLDYPPENVFIPKSFELHPLHIETNPKHPQKLLDEEGIAVWYKQDDTFKLPKAIALCQIYLNKSFKSFIEYETIAYIWNSIVENELRELAYMAEEANVKFKFHVNNEGMFLCVSGYSYSLPNALVQLTKLFRSLTAEDKGAKLKLQIERHIQEMQNFYYRAPYMQIMGYMEMLLTEPSAFPCDKLKVLNSGIIIDDLVKFVTKFHNEIRYEWLIQGNVLPGEALDMAKVVQDIFQAGKLPATESIIFRTVNIQQSSDFVYTFDNVNAKEDNSAIVSFYQCGKLDEFQTALLLLVESLLNDRFFNELRTKQALGYITALQTREYRCNQGLFCLVQSSVKSPEFIWQRISEFMSDSEKFINEISDDLFNMHIQSVITEKQQKDLSLNEEIYRNFYEVKIRDFVFDRRERIIKVLESLKKEDLITFYQKMFIKDHKRLNVMILASCHKEENFKYELENINLCREIGINRVKLNTVSDFKRKNSLCPDYYSF